MPMQYLGYTIFDTMVKPQKVQLVTHHLKTLNDFQKLLGDINWLRPSLGITTSDLRPLFDILRGDSDPSSPRMLTVEGAQALRKVEQAIEQAQCSRINFNEPLVLVVIATS